MSWTEQETLKFQMDNNQALLEINKTLIGLTGKPIIGIFAPGQAGDCGVCTSVLKYKDELWPGKDIVWFANYPVADILRYAPINEVRPWLWAGNGLPLGTPDYWPLLTTPNKRLNQGLKLNFGGVADVLEGYFPTPYMTEPINRHNVEYSNVSKRVFGVPDDWTWHPYLSFSEEERSNAKQFVNHLPPGKKIFFETFAGSGQSRLDEDMVRRSMDMCREKWPGCIFIFASHKFLKANEDFPEWLVSELDFYCARKFTVRQCALIAEQCDLMISVSSGVTVASNAWGIRTPKTIQFCGSKICSTSAISNGLFELITADDKMFEQAKTQYYLKLITLLSNE
jgi:hypothetical protein